MRQEFCASQEGRVEMGGKCKNPDCWPLPPFQEGVDDVPAAILQVEMCKVPLELAVVKGLWFCFIGRCRS